MVRGRLGARLRCCVTNMFASKVTVGAFELASTDQPSQLAFFVGTGSISWWILSRPAGDESISHGPIENRRRVCSHNVVSPAHHRHEGPKSETLNPFASHFSRERAQRALELGSCCLKSRIAGSSRFHRNDVKSICRASWYTVVDRVADAAQAVPPTAAVVVLRSRVYENTTLVPGRRGGATVEEGTRQVRPCARTIRVGGAGVVETGEAFSIHLCSLPEHT